MKNAPVIPLLCPSQPHPKAAIPLALLKLTEVQRRTALSKTTIYDLIKKGDFPAQVSLGGKSTAWVESEVSDWIETRIDASRKEGVV